MISKVKKILSKWLQYKASQTSETPDFLKDHPRFQRYNIGKGTYGVPKILSWDDDSTLHIGNYCSIANNVEIMLGGEHHTNWISTYPFNTMENNIIETDKNEVLDRKTKGDVVIQNDVWIGRNALIMSGVTIGNGVVIGARSVVTKDLDDYGIYAGNPARLIRYRFTEEEIAQLNNIAWWQWDAEKITTEKETLMSENIDSFIQKHTTADE